MTILLIIYAGVLTLFTIGLLYTYESKIKSTVHALDQMTKRFHIAKQSVLDAYRLLDEDNKALQSQVESLKAELAGDESKIQYESHTYTNSIYGHTPYVNPWRNTLPDLYHQEDLDFDQ